MKEWKRVRWLALATAGLLACASAAGHPERRAHAQQFRSAQAERLATVPVEGAPPERWFMPGALGHVPGAPPPEPGRHAFRSRAIGGTHAGAAREWAQANHLTPRLARGHNLDRILTREMFAERPELFPLVGGKRYEPPVRSRSNWNPDLGSEAVVEFVADAAEAFFDENPEAEAFSVGTNDGLVFGDSEDTLQWVYPPRWFRQRPDYSDLVSQFTNRVAERLEASHPDRYVTQLAYYWSENVPSFPVHPRVVPILTADRSQFYDAAFREEELALVRAWGDSGAERLSLYDYSYGRNFLIPRIYVRHFAEHLRNARDAGFTDYFTEMTPNWGLDGPQPWIVARLLSDPRKDVEALWAEYFARFFGPAAVPMERFFALAEELWRTQEGPPYWLKHFRNESQALVIPPGARRALRGYLDAAAEAAGARSPYAERVGLTSRAFALSERFLEMVESRREVVDALFAEAPPGAPFRAALERYTEARPAFEEYVERLWDEAPLAVARADLAAYLLHDPAPTAKAWLEGRLDPPVAAVEALVETQWPSGDLVGMRVAGLPYRLDLPEPWRSQAEPWEGLGAEGREGPDGSPVLRMENHKISSFWQWTPVRAGHVGRAEVSVRGELSPGAYALLSVRWGSAAGSLVGPQTDVRLPEGRHWRAVPLRQFIEPPPDADYVLVRILVAHQQPDDWLEFGRPSLLWWQEEG
ncbi:MAG: DUF4838 domain-containing protein [Opitutales bacterium]|nr:DUF4838 domain-containing protein [Opitutales bacterium]